MGKHLTEEMAKTLVERFAEKQRSGHFACPRCGCMAMGGDPARKALSRRASVYVCNTCGAEEALEDMQGSQTPLTDWAISTGPTGWCMLSGASDHIRVEGHIGTWYVIGEGDFILTPDTDGGQPLTIHAHLFLLEHEQYGDEAARVIVDDSGSLILEDVWNGFGDLEEAGWAKEGETS